jgi:hypothetical protein
MEIKKLVNNVQKFICNTCDFSCSTKTDWDRHILRPKHIKTLNGNNTEIMEIEKNLAHICECKKRYKTNSGLWKHKKICEFIKKCDLIIPTKEIEPDNNVINTLINENKSLKEFMMEQSADFKNIILEVCKNFQPSNMNNSHNNSHNKTFNLQVFLNETCKDAMNIMDFADSIKLQLTDLENVGEYGFVNGISKIIIKSLQEMDINLRPVHCSDLKREVAYVRENGKWEKDTPDNKLIKKAIKRVAHRNIRQIPEWKKLYPDCGLSDSKKSDQYNELTVEAMGGRGDNDDAKANKIVRKIIQNVVIDKKMM